MTFCQKKWLLLEFKTKNSSILLGKTFSIRDSFCTLNFFILTPQFIFFCLMEPLTEKTKVRRYCIQIPIIIFLKSCVQAFKFMHVVCFLKIGKYTEKCLMRCQNWRLNTTFCNFTPILHAFCVEKIKVSSCYSKRCRSPQYTYKWYFPPHGRD